MPSDKNQQTSEYDKIVATLRQYNSINIIRTKGEPPDHYEIEYRLKGYITAPDNLITTDGLHKIQINLPFGYPHFSPTCKPLTPIFHPDFDSEAIRVADFWNEDKSLAGLIIHIGKMICGETYSIVDPFNQQALDWYEDHRSDLPLDTLQGSDADEPADDGIDTLDDDLFTSLMLEDDAEEPSRSFEPEPSPEQPSLPPQTDEAELLREAIDQKRIFEARLILRQLSHDSTLPGRSEISQSITEVIEKAKEYHAEAAKLEQRGKLEQAQAAYEKVEKIVSDFPGLDEDYQRVEQSLQLTKNLGNQPPRTTPGPPRPLPPPPGTGFKTIKPLSTSKKPTKPTLSKKKKLYLVGALCIVFIIVGVKIYLGSTNTYMFERAESNLSLAQTLIDKQDYKNAEKRLEKVKIALGKIWFNKSKKSNLHDKMETLLTSPQLVEGLKGNIEFQGKYIPADKVATLREIDQKLDKAADLVEESKWKLAADQYKKALGLASDAGFTEKYQEIEQTFARVKLDQALLAGRNAEAEQQWLAAGKHYQRALKIAGSLPEEIEQIEISGRLAEVKFHHLFEQGKQAFVESEWQQAIDFIQQAQEIIEHSPAGLTNRKKNLLEKNLFQVKLYQIRAKAIQEFNAANWDKSIRLYEQALAMITDNEAFIDDTVRTNIENIKRSKLLAAISSDREQAILAGHNDDNKLALQHYNGIIATLNKCDVDMDSELRSIRLETESKILKLKEQLFLDSKISYLTDNYQRLIKGQYPNARPAKLENPKAVLLKKQGRDLIFELSCIERSRSSNFRLVLNYRYSPITDSWSLYNE